MKHNQYEFDARVWLYPGNAAWHFVTVPKDISEDITRMFSDRKRGWGSLPIVATVGKITWKTSIFPDTKLGAYLLPLKKIVREAEKITVSNSISVLIEIVV